MCGSAADSASWKKTKQLPSTKTTMMICAKVSVPMASAATMLAARTALTPSLASMTRLRSHRSTRAPAGRYSSRKGTDCAEPARPALSGEWVTASTSSG